MSVRLVSRLPNSLAEPIKLQYDSLQPIFKKYAFSEGNQYYGLVKLNYEFSCFLLETALFYKNVVVPMSRGSQAFIYRANNEIETVKMGKHVLTALERQKIRKIELEFNEILNKYNVPLSLLLFSDVKDFARSLNTFFESQQYA